MELVHSTRGEEFLNVCAHFLRGCCQFLANEGAIYFTGISETFHQLGQIELSNDHDEELNIQNE